MPAEKCECCQRYGARKIVVVPHTNPAMGYKQETMYICRRCEPKVDELQKALKDPRHRVYFS